MKGYAAHEKETLEAVDQGPQRRDRAPGAGRQAQAEQAQPGRCASSSPLSEAYPDLKANQNFLELQEELTATEGRVAYAWQFYNDSVLGLQHQIQSFPGSLFAKRHEASRDASTSRRKRAPARLRPSSSDRSLKAVPQMYEQIARPTSGGACSSSAASC